MEGKVCILIVIYNKEVASSETILSILNNNVRDVTLHIHNNGPKNITIDESILRAFSDKNIKHILVNCIENKPLGILYNDFISVSSAYDKFVILDDDSTVTESFIDELNEDEYDISIPIIISRSDNTQYYPLKSGLVYNYTGSLNSIMNIWSIGSGIIFSKKIVDSFHKNNLKLFDENYALYGVDISFFRNLWNLEGRKEFFNIRINSKLIHSLSRTDAHQTDFRIRERLIDIAITARRYPTWRRTLSLIKNIAINVSKGKIVMSFIAMKCYFTGKHPRVIKWESNLK